MIRRLKVEIKRDGFTFSQMYKTDNAYAYCVEDNINRHFEVFERRHREGREIYPTTEDFDNWAWMVEDSVAALKKISEIETKKRES